MMKNIASSTVSIALMFAFSIPAAGILKTPDENVKADNIKEVSNSALVYSIDNPGHEDLHIDSVTLQPATGVNTNEHRVSYGSRFTLRVVVGIDSDHFASGTGRVDRDMINVRAIGKSAAAPVDDRGLVTELSLINGYTDQAVCTTSMDRLAGVTKSSGTKSKAISKAFLAERMVPSSEDSARAISEIYVADRVPPSSENSAESPACEHVMFDINDHTISKIFEFEILSSRLYPGRWHFTFEVDHGDHVAEYREGNNIYPAGGTDYEIIMGDVPVINNFDVRGRLFDEDRRFYATCLGEWFDAHYTPYVPVRLWVDYDFELASDSSEVLVKIYYYKFREFWFVHNPTDWSHTCSPSLAFDDDYVVRFKECLDTNAVMLPDQSELSLQDEQVITISPGSSTHVGSVQTRPLDRGTVMVFSVETDEGVAQEVLSIIGQSYDVVLDKNGKCLGYNFSGSPYARDINESKDWLEDRRWVGIRRNANLDWIPLWDSDRDKPSLVSVAKLWRAFYDPDPEFTINERRDLIEEVNNYLLRDDVVPGLIGTDEEALTSLGINGGDYDFKLRILTTLANKFGNLSDPALEDALWPETREKIMTVMLNQSGNNHHTKVATEEELEHNMKRVISAVAWAGALTGLDLILYNTLSLLPELRGMMITLQLVGPIQRAIMVSAIGAIIVNNLIDGDIPETENHQLMSETSRYLKNQQIASGDYSDLFPDWDSATYDNRTNGFNEWMIKHLFQFLLRDFEEYNSNTYSGYSTAALLNLYDYATEPDVKLSARIILDYISARFAIQSFDLKRQVGLCRKPDRLDANDLWRDAMAPYYAVFIGNYAGLMDGYYSGMWSGDNSIGYASFSSYQMPDLLLDLAIHKEHNPYEVHVNHSSHSDLDRGYPHSDNIEILSANRGYLLTAGGHYSASRLWWIDLLKSVELSSAGEYDGWAKSTALITRGNQRILEETGDPDPYRTDFVIYSIDEGNLQAHMNNTGVYRNVAVSPYAFHIPEQYSGILDTRGDWHFLHLENQGLYVGINTRAKLLEVVDDSDHGGGTFAEFRDHCRSQSFDDSGTGEYSRYENPSDTVLFSTLASIGDWPIENKDGDLDGDADSADRNVRNWPLIESVEADGLNRVMWADGRGKVIVNNPYMRKSLILSLVDWRNPIRLEQACVAEDATRGLATDNFGGVSTPSNEPHHAFDDDYDTAWMTTPWETGGNELTVDFDSEERFNFISIRTDVNSSNGVRRVQVLTRGAAETDFTPIGSWTVPDNRHGIDLLAGAQSAAAVKFVFEMEDFAAGLPIPIQEIEIYRYEEILDGDRYENNDVWQDAASIDTGRHADATLHSGLDVDFYKVDLLENNRLRATVDRSQISDLHVELWTMPAAGAEPTLLVSDLGGDSVQWPAADVAPDHLREEYIIKIYSERGLTGNYTFFVQTRGPEFTGDVGASDGHDGEDLAGPGGLYLATMDPIARLGEFVTEDEEPFSLAPVHPEGGSHTVRVGGETTTVRGMINTGGPFMDSSDFFLLTPHNMDRDYYTVMVPRGKHVEIKVTPVDSDIGHPYAAIEDQGTYSTFNDDRSDWPTGAQVLTVYPGSRSNTEVSFSVRADFEENYRNDTGLYELTVTIKASSDIYIPETIDTAPSHFNDGVKLAQDLINEIKLMSKTAMKDQIFKIVKVPTSPGDPYVIDVVSNSTGVSQFRIELDSQMISKKVGTAKEFNRVIDDLNMILLKNHKAVPPQ